MSEYGDTIGRLQQKRVAAMALIERLDNAIQVLRDLETEETPTESVAPEDQKISVAVSGVGSVGSSVLTQMRGPERKSIKQRVVGLLRDHPARDYGVATIIRHFELANEPLEAKDVGNAVRTALSEAVKEEAIVRRTTGVYRGVPWSVDRPILREVR